MPSFLLCLGLAGLLVLWAGSVAPRVQVDPELAFAVAYLAVTLEILALATRAPRLASRATLLVAVVMALGLWSLAGLAATPLTGALLTLVLGSGATLLGSALGQRIEKPGQLAAVALVSAIADSWSVFDPSAPSARFAEQVIAQPEQLALFALPFPMLGTSWVPAVIGGGDVLFAALYVAGFRAHGLSLRGVTLALAAAFVLGLVGLLVTLRPLPLLPLLGAAVIAVDPAARSLTAREWRTVSFVCAALVVGIALRIAR